VLHRPVETTAKTGSRRLREVRPKSWLGSIIAGMLIFSEPIDLVRILCLR